MGSQRYESFLRDLCSEVEPTSVQTADASRSHTQLRELLDTGQMASRVVESYLSGSYARDTAIRPLDDVDIIFIIDPKHWKCPWYRTYPAPDSILDSFASAIRHRYPDLSVVKQRRSVCLQLHQLDIDVVPAIADKKHGDFIHVADRDRDEWLRSSPKTHSAVGTEVNQRRDGSLKPLVKLLKHWNGSLPTTARVKSFAIETIATRMFDKTNFSSLQDGLFKFFDFLAHFLGDGQEKWDDSFGISLSTWTREVPDIAGTGSNLFARVDANRRDRFLSSARHARDLLLDAENTKISEEGRACVRRAVGF